MAQNQPFSGNLEEEDEVEEIEKETCDRGLTDNFETAFNFS